MNENIITSINRWKPGKHQTLLITSINRSLEALKATNFG
jgi:hypothetical protein